MRWFGNAKGIPQDSRLLQIAWIPCGLVLLAVALRAPGLSRPLVGNFATKNVTYAMIARNWAEGRTSLWYPRFDRLAGTELAGTERTLYLQEFPVSAYLAGALWKGLGGSLEVWGRLTSIAFTAAAVLLMYAWMLGRHGPGVATPAALALALSPVSVIYGQSFIIQASLVSFVLAMFLSWDRWLEGGKSPWLMLAATMLSLVLLTKIYMLVLVLPLAAMAWRARLGAARRGTAMIAGLIALVPVTAWYGHVVGVSWVLGPESPKIEYSLVAVAGEHRPPHPLLWSADFYRRVLDDLATVVLTPVGFLLPAVALLERRWRSYLPWLVAMAVLLIGIPRKFFELNYYYVGVLPPLCILVGLGWDHVQRRLRPSVAARVAVLGLALLVSLRYSLGPAFLTPVEDRGVVAAAQAVRERTSPEQPVVAMHGSSIDLLYYCDRPGWNVAPEDPDLAQSLEAFARAGAEYLVVAGPEADARRETHGGGSARSPDAQGGETFAPPRPPLAAASVLRGYPVVASGDGYCVLRLRPVRWVSCRQR
jgi:4-amino-4-deoxy-L-arabinose transferase-like glycosyltransferase